MGISVFFLTARRQPGAFNRALLWSFQPGSPIRTVNQAAMPEPRLGDPKPKLGDPKPRFGILKPRLGDPMPRLGDRKPGLGSPSPGVGPPA